MTISGAGGIAVQTGGVGPQMIRLAGVAAPELAAELLVPGRVLEAEVVSSFAGRGILAFGRGVRLEVSLQVPLQEGQRVRLQVLPGDGSQPAVLMRLLSAGPARSEGAAAPAQAQPAPQPAAVIWLPIGLPEGGQGWVQLYVEEGQEQGQAGKGAASGRQVRLYWETPGLGPVQVVLDAPDQHVSALFTAAQAESRAAISAALPELGERLAEAGFPAPRLGCRAPAPGEAVRPARPASSPLLDRRI